MALTIISTVLALLKAIPVLDGWFKQLAIAWADMKLREHDREFAEAHIALMRDRDQTLLEGAIGSPNAGKPGMDNRDIVDRPHGGAK